MKDAREGVRGGDCACEGRDGRGRRYDMTGDAALGRLIRRYESKDTEAMIAAQKLLRGITWKQIRQSVTGNAARGPRGPLNSLNGRR